MLTVNPTEKVSSEVSSAAQPKSETSSANPLLSDKSPSPNIISQFSIFVGRLNYILNSVTQTQFDKSWANARATLDALPLGTDRYDVAASRLTNCRRYARSGEIGAAKYELKLLCGCLDLPKF